MSKTPMRHQSQQNQSQQSSGGYSLSTGVMNFLLFTLGWSALSHLSMIVGIWDYEGSKSTFDVVMSTLNVILPIFGIVFLMILYDRER